MSTVNWESIVTRCDELTKNGEELSISWNGGNDSGLFEMKLDGEPVDDDDPIERPIVDLLENELGYGSFAGDFSADGEVVYNRERKCFEGTDTYTESRSCRRECSIKVRMPADIWFDRVDFDIQCADDTDLEVLAHISVFNGPRVDAHAGLELRLAKLVHDAVANEIAGIDGLCGIWTDIALPKNLFSATGKELVTTINEFFYSRYEADDKDIEIYLTDQIEEDVSI
jgi:hypothetical protein